MTDIVKYGVAKLIDDAGNAKVYYLGEFNGTLGTNIRLVFDGETGELKAAEVIPLGTA